MIESHFLQELKTTLAAGYPLVFVFTSEEERASALLAEAARQSGRTLIRPRIKGETSSVAEMLRKSDEADCLILLDAAHFTLSESGSIRALADTGIGSNRGRTVAIVCPWAEIPKELEKMSAVLSLPLPGMEALGAVCDRAAGETGFSPTVDERDEWVKILRGMTETEAYFSSKKAFLSGGGVFDAARVVLIEEKKAMLRKSRVLESVALSTDMDEIGGMDRLKNWLIERKDAFSPAARDFGLSAPRGLLLMGVQGCGKSMMAKAVAHHWKLPLARLDLSAVFGAVSPEGSLRDALLTAEAMAPMVLWIDEIEKAFEKSGGGVGSRVLGKIVTWLQEKSQDVFVAATANRVADLPPELPRKGRFDEVFFVDLPDLSERRDILRIHLAKRGRNPDKYDLQKLAEKTERFTGSELEQLISAGLFQAFAEKRELTDNDLRWAAKETVPLFEMYEEEIKALREWAAKRARPAATDRRKLNLFSGKHSGVKTTE